MRLPHHHYFIFTLCTTNYMPFYRFPSSFSFSCTRSHSTETQKLSRDQPSCASFFFCLLHYVHHDITHYILQPTPKCHQIRHKLCSSYSCSEDTKKRRKEGKKSQKKSCAVPHLLYTIHGYEKKYTWRKRARENKKKKSTLLHNSTRDMQSRAKVGGAWMQAPIEATL